MESEGKYQEAIKIYSRVVKIPHIYVGSKIFSQFHIATCYEKAGDYNRAQEELTKVFSIPVKPGVNIRYIKAAFDKLDRMKIGKEKYIKILETILLNVPATEENAEFLGRVKSELEKLK